MADDVWKAAGPFPIDKLERVIERIMMARCNDEVNIKVKITPRDELDEEKDKKAVS